MKPISDETLDVLESAAVEGAKQIKAFFKYEGDNPRYYQKGKLGGVAIGGYGKIRQSETGRLAVELSLKKLEPPVVS